MADGEESIDRLAPALQLEDVITKARVTPVASAPLGDATRQAVAVVHGPLNQPAPDAASNTVALGRVGFALAWTGIYSLHAVSAAYLVAAGRVYTVLPTTEVCLMFQLYQLTLHPTWFSMIAWVHYALAGIHVYYLLKPILTWACRCLPAMQTHRWLGPLRGRGDTFLARHASRLYDLLFARDGVFGVHSPYYELYFLAREVVETVLQSYQAYNMTRLLPRAMLNGAYTLVLVINCWTTPLLQRVCRGHKPLGRLLCVLCDVVLDFVSSVGVPVVVAAGYLRQYDPVATNFAPPTLYYDDVWLLNFLNETPLILFGSRLDAGSRLVFSLGLLASLDDVKALVTTAAPLGKDTTHHVGKRPSHKVSSRTTSSFLLKLQAPKVQNRTSKWIHSAMILWGLGIAIVHLEASLRALPSHCSLPLKPWLVTQPACAVVTIDCQKDQSLSGNATDFESVYSRLDAGAVEYVIFRHCPHVEFTPRFLTFHNLYGVKTYNSTIETWHLDAAFTTAAHPRVRFAFFVVTHFPNATLPPGVCHTDFPQTLTDIEISVSNLETLPATLPWPLYMVIYIELSPLDAFPPVLVDLYPYTLSLAYNQLRDLTVPLTAWRFARLYVRGNPIQSLPDAIPPITTHHMHVLSLEYTALATLPEWVTAELLDSVQLLAAQTPLCVDVFPNPLVLEERPWLAQVQQACAEDPGPYGLYPLEMDAR